MELKHKVFAYITHGNRLLVFDHPHHPEAGTQVPAGTRPEDEPPDVAVLREAREETGLSGLTLLGFLGEVDHPALDRGQLHRRRFYHLRCSAPPPERWQHYERLPSDGTTEPILFDFYWVDLPDGVPALAPGHDAMLGELVNRMSIRFTSPTEHPPGTVFGLLRQAWAPLWNPELGQKIRQFDSEVTEHPDTVGACTFITCAGAEPVGMASYDPRQKPERGIIGWNCVVPRHQRRSIGKAQIQEILRIFRIAGFRKACVSTGLGDFFVPAQRTYESCSFVRARTTADNNIEYEVDL